MRQPGIKAQVAKNQGPGRNDQRSASSFSSRRRSLEPVGMAKYIDLTRSIRNDELETIPMGRFFLKQMGQNIQNPANIQETQRFWFTVLPAQCESNQLARTGENVHPFDPLPPSCWALVLDPFMGHRAPGFLDRHIFWVPLKKLRVIYIYIYIYIYIHIYIYNYTQWIMIPQRTDILPWT